MAGYCIWKKIKSLAYLLQLGSHWVLGNGNSILLWHDKWIDHDPIAQRFPHLLFSGKDQVADLIQGNSWSIPASIPAEVQGYLLQQTYLFPLFGTSAPDKLSWSGVASRVLTLKLAWDTLRSRQAAVAWDGLVWNKILNPRLSCFSWRLLLRKMPTDYWAMQKGISMASKCYSCHSNSESDLHLFFLCALSQQFWHWLLSINGSPIALPLSASDVWTALVKGVYDHGRKSATTIFFQAIYILWSIRNAAKHRSMRPSLKKVQLFFHDSCSDLFRSCSAYANLVALDQGTWIHVYIERAGIMINERLLANLIYMYAKCGEIKFASKIFFDEPTQKVWPWNAMIGGLAMHGLSKEAINLFEQMKLTNVAPEYVTFIVLLNACSSGLLVDGGCLYFKSMSCVHGVEPKIEHYGCMPWWRGRRVIAGGEEEKEEEEEEKEKKRKEGNKKV
ncbi:pentatricopeptide repeat-containing protein isoform X1 [Cinnamomum micranthum f. kanehirae]|uniref:Pentatricopeptide repeat-containing protein isoform X1 n=1 Tax=Cinnamomum micranthum f. kanehirae TaxID=337451 RepID=A0A3S3PAC8_9MAGN|nr:pentatricopeptide repeat-containing protein isoform X1 [Cinnamomum micranthum f. kanehirae]